MVRPFVALLVLAVNCHAESSGSEDDVLLQSARTSRSMNIDMDENRNLLATRKNTGIFDDFSKFVAPVAQTVVQPFNEHVVQPFDKHVVKPFVSTTEKGAAWAAGAAKDAGKWTAGAAQDAGAWTKQAADDAVQWSGNAGKDVGDWFEGAGKDVSGWTRDAGKDAGNWCEGAFEDLQEFAEDVGDFLTNSGKTAEEWVKEFLQKVVNSLVEQVKKAVGKVSACVGLDTFPDVSTNKIKNSPCVKTATTIMETVLTAVNAAGNGINGLGSAVSNMIADGGMYRAIFGLLGEEVVNRIEGLFTKGPQALFADVDVKKAIGDVSKIMATYWRKHAVGLANQFLTTVTELIEQVDKLQQQIRGLIESFTSKVALLELGVNASEEDEEQHNRSLALLEAARGWQGKHWYIALCGSVSAIALGMGPCVYYPFVLGELPDRRNMVFSFAIGLVAGDGEFEGGIKLGPIFTNDLSSLQGSAQSVGIDIDLGSSGYPNAALDLSLTWPDPKGPLISFDILGGVGSGVSKVQVATSGATPMDFTPFYSGEFGFAPLKDVPKPMYFLQMNQTTQDAEDDVENGNHTMPLLIQESAVQTAAADELRGVNAADNIYVATNPNSASFLQRSGGSLIAESNVDRKYAVFNGPCLPEAAILTPEECLYAYNRMKPMFSRPSKRGLVRGVWNGVPWSCSIQYQGYYVGVNGDSSPHWNTYAQTDNARAISGEFRSICRRLYVLHVSTAPTCPPGAEITSPRDCWDAYVEVQGKFTHKPKRQLVTGDWDGVPRGCSIQFSGTHVQRNKDQSPHWNSRSSSSNSRSRSGEFRNLCKAQRFWMTEQGAGSCPAGSVIEETQTCQNAYVTLQHRFTVRAKRGLVVGNWNGVPPGCSIQYAGTHPSAHSDQSPHFNKYLATSSTRATSGEFVNLCKQPAYWMSTANTCPLGSQIISAFHCKAAYEFLRNSFSIISRRGLVSGNWNGVPDGCSIQYMGGYVTSQGDSSPHWNNYPSSNNLRAISGEFRPLCMPAEYFMPNPGTATCPPGTDITSEYECEKAHSNFHFDQAAKRGLVSGAWNGVPRFCSIQYAGHHVIGNKDASPHFNTRASSSNSRATSGEFVPICKVPGHDNFGAAFARPPRGNVYKKNPALGAQWGGKCTCPNGQSYDVSDNGDYCRSMQCVNGVASTCEREAKQSRTGMKVTCAK